MLPNGMKRKKRREKSSEGQISVKIDVARRKENQDKGKYRRKGRRNRRQQKRNATEWNEM